MRGLKQKYGDFVWSNNDNTHSDFFYFTRRRWRVSLSTYAENYADGYLTEM